MLQPKRTQDHEVVGEQDADMVVRIRPGLQLRGIHMCALHPRQSLQPYKFGQMNKLCLTVKSYSMCA